MRIAKLTGSAMAVAVTMVISASLTPSAFAVEDPKDEALRPIADRVHELRAGTHCQVPISYDLALERVAQDTARDWSRDWHRHSVLLTGRIREAGYSWDWDKAGSPLSIELTGYGDPERKAIDNAVHDEWGNHVHNCAYTAFGVGFARDENSEKDHVVIVLAEKARPSSPPVPHGDGVPNDWKDMLAAHNERRALHCAQPLVWSAKLAEAAAAYVGKCDLQNHDTAVNKAMGYGENLAFFTRKQMDKPVLPAATDREAFENSWYCEIKWYDFAHPSIQGGVKKECDPPVNGHFTQVVWKSTRELGCARNTCTQNGQVGTGWVCKYSPVGNTNTAQALGDNVSSTTCGTSTKAFVVDPFRQLGRVGIDTSIPEDVMRGYLNNEHTPYPSIGKALLTLLAGKRLKQPVQLDVLVPNYEGIPGTKSPRSVSDVEMQKLRAAVVSSYNERYGTRVKRVEEILQ